MKIIPSKLPLPPSLFSLLPSPLPPSPLQHLKGERGEKSTVAGFFFLCQTLVHHTVRGQSAFPAVEYYI